MNETVKTVYKICIPNTHRNWFDYDAGSLVPVIGARVLVPFRKQIRLGLIINEGAAENSKTVLKTIVDILDETPLLDEKMLALCKWISTYYQSPLSEVIPLALPKKYRLGQPCSLPIEDYYQLAVPVDEAKQRIPAQARKQLALLDFLVQHSSVNKTILSQHGFKAAPINALSAAGIIHSEQKISLPYKENPSPDKPLTLNDEQAFAVQTILEQLHAYHCFLLLGITGSGKTEVYLQVIGQVLTQGKQVLVLVPEIGLTPQLLSRFTARFSEPIAVIHSNLNETERQIAWQSAKESRVKLIIGTRAAIFTPMPALGLIIIDEEHDSSLKQIDGVRYSARDTALMRAHSCNIPIVLGTATPSLESLHNCNQKKYTLLRLTQKALVSNPLHYQLIDLRSLPLQQGLANSTLKIIAEHLAADNQVLVFINRRGFSPVLLCHQCGWMSDCRACDSHLTLHRKTNRLMCHHCGLAQAIPTTCPSCQGKELIPVGAGTQRIHDFLSAQFPHINVVRIDRDEVQKKNALDTQLARISSGEVQLIVGTQMLAKGHHFPRLTLVVILDTDAGFYNQDFRAMERLGQLLVQVAGRAGRAQHAGQVVIQTHLPQHPLLNLIIQQGYDQFAQALLTARQQAQLPPYHFLAVIRAQDKIPGKVLGFLHAIKQELSTSSLHVLGPAPAPLARKADQHRMQLLLKSPSRKLLQTTLTILREWLTINKQFNNVRWNVDVDPVDLS